MKKLFLFFAGMFFILAAFTNAQNVPKSNILLSKGNVVVSDNTTTMPDRCGTMDHLQWMLDQDPTLKAKMELENKKLDDYIATHQQELENDKTDYVIPCVVHIVYNGSAQNISDARVIEQITQTNKDWGGTNGRSMGVFASTLRANTGISLCLATKDPSGNTTTGITRTTTTTTFTHNHDSHDDDMKYTATGGINAWDPTKYFNIWVCNLPSGLAGFGLFPTAGMASNYGAVINYLYFGLTGATSPFNGGGTLSHEGGHCFNLIHIWGDENLCAADDGVTDTPMQAAATTGHHSGLLTDACSTTSPGIMYMNFMDYSNDGDYACMTTGQATRMKAVVTTYMTSLVAAGATECSSTPSAPVANFTASATTVPVNTTVTFTDLSTNTPTQWSWALTPSTGFSYQGGTSAASKNPQIKFTTAGSYTVALTATNGVGPNTCTKTNYITVTNGGTPTCDTLHYPLTGTATIYGVPAANGGGYVSGNNGYGDKAKADYFATYSPYTIINSVYLGFGVAKHTGSTTNITINVWNNSGTSGAPGTIIGTTTVPLATIVTNTTNSQATLATFTTPITITGPFYIGVMLPTITGDTLALATNTNGNTNPGTGWEMNSGGSWYAYSDATNSWGVNVSNTIFPIVCTTGVGIEESSTNNILIYPNPANDVLNIDLANYGNNKVDVEIFNSIGGLIKSIENKSMSPMMKIDLADVKSGIYYIIIKTEEGSSLSKKITIMK